MAQRFQIEPAKLLEVLKATVIKSTDKHEVTNEEVAAFVIVANQYGLNPFTREIHAFAGRGGGIVPIVGVDGWSHVVNSNPTFDGCEFIDVLDEKYGIGMKCVMYVKGRTHPVSATEWLTECQRPTEPWKGMPRRMLRHKAFMQTARICFGLSGLYDEDEAADIIRNQTATIPVEENGNGKSRTESLADRIERQLEKPKATEVFNNETRPNGAETPSMADVAQTTADTPLSSQLRESLEQIRQSLEDKIESAIEGATTQDQFGEAGSLMNQNIEVLGDSYERLLEFYQRKYKERFPPTAKNVKAKGK